MPPRVPTSATTLVAPVVRPTPRSLAANVLRVVQRPRTRRPLVLFKATRRATLPPRSCTSLTHVRGATRPNGAPLPHVWLSTRVTVVTAWRAAPMPIAPFSVGSLASTNPPAPSPRCSGAPLMRRSTARASPGRAPRRVGVNLWGTQERHMWPAANHETGTDACACLWSGKARKSWLETFVVFSRTTIFSQASLVAMQRWHGRVPHGRGWRAWAPGHCSSLTPKDGAGASDW